MPCTSWSNEWQARARPAAARIRRDGTAAREPRRWHDRDAPSARAGDRLGREKPGAVLGGPPIAVTCECGAKHDLAYGDAWTCERCGRRWDTNQIPREEYERRPPHAAALPRAAGRVRAVRARARAVLHLTRNIFSVFFLLPVALSVWFVFLRPVHRQRYRRAIAELPRWELHPE